MEYNWTGGLWSLLHNNQVELLHITVKNDNKPLVKFLNGKNTNNKVNRWSLKRATYNITFKWISGVKTKQLIAFHD